MQEYRNLVTERNTKTVKPNNKKDKLSETKKREAEIKAALKEVRDNKKVEKKEERAQKAHEFKLDRLDNHPESKRTQKDVRYLTHLEKKNNRNTGITCEHGVWKCKICYPYKSYK